MRTRLVSRQLRSRSLRSCVLRFNPTLRGIRKHTLWIVVYDYDNDGDDDNDNVVLVGIVVVAGVDVVVDLVVDVVIVNDYV